MTRTATGDALTESQSEAPRPFVLVQLDFPSGFLRVNSSDRSVFFDSGSGSVEFLGVGRLGSISTITEGSDLAARGVELSLSGILAAHVSAAFENAQRRSGKVWTGYFDSDYVLVADPILFFSGLIDNTAVALGETATVTIFLESRLITWQRPKIQRYTNENQQLRFSGDKFLEFVNQMVEKELLWGIAGDGTPIVQTVSLSSSAGQEFAREVTFRGETFTLLGGAGGDGGGGGGGGGDGGGSCFPAGTLVLMLDGQEQAIETIHVGDKTAGGRVIGTMTFETTDLFVYQDVVVSGGHAVYHQGVWTRVKDVDAAKPLDAARAAMVDKLYVLKTSHQRIYINNVTFADYVEAAPGSSIYAKYNAALLAELRAQDEFQTPL